MSSIHLSFKISNLHNLHSLTFFVISPTVSQASCLLSSNPLAHSDLGYYGAWIASCFFPFSWLLTWDVSSCTTCNDSLVGWDIHVLMLPIQIWRPSSWSNIQINISSHWLSISLPLKLLLNSVVMISPWYQNWCSIENKMQGE